MTRYRARYLDPEGDRYGLPTYPWRSAPLGLATRRQLRDRGLCPGGRPIAAQVKWRRRGDDVVAYLYDVATARPKRTATPAVLRALARALEARRTCPTCREVRDYVNPRSLGDCLDCAEDPAPTTPQEAA
jgi:hypothetical protein